MALIFTDDIILLVGLSSEKRKLDSTMHVCKKQQWLLMMIIIAARGVFFSFPHHDDEDRAYIQLGAGGGSFPPNKFLPPKDNEKSSYQI